MTGRRIGVWFLLGLCLALALSGCARQDAAREVAVGVVWPFSEGGLFEKGVDLAIRQINAAGGVHGKNIVLMKKDDGSEVTKGIAIAQSMAQDASILAVIGHQDSFVSIPASAIYEEAGLAMLSPASTAPVLTQNGYQNIFRSTPGDTAIARRLAALLSSQGLKRLVIYYSDDDYGKGLAGAFEDAARQAGMAVVDRVSSYAGPEELRRLHARWQAFGFDGIFVASSMPEGAQFILDARQAGIHVPFAGGDALDEEGFATVGDLAAEETVVGSVFDTESGSPEAQRFVQAFVEAYGEAPDVEAARGYDAAGLIAAALEKTGGQSRSEVSAALREMGEWPGALGVHKLSAAGEDSDRLVVLKQWKNGAFVCLPAGKE